MKRFVLTALFGITCLAPLMGCVVEPAPRAYVAAPEPVVVGPVFGPPVYAARPRYYRRGYYVRPRPYWRHNYRHYRHYRR